jgi:O-antigen/teichoic acid export membrane protein
MLRRFFIDSSIYAVATAASQGILFILFPFFAHVFQPRDYGAIDILGLLGILVNLTVALEISQALGRYLYESKSAAERSIYTSTALLFTLFCFFVFAAVTLPFSAYMSHAIFESAISPGVMRIAIAGWWVNGILYLMQDQLRWRLRSGAFAAVSIIVALATTVTSAVLVLGLRTGVSGAIVGQLVGCGCGLIVTISLSRGIYTRRFDWHLCRNMLRYSIPLIPASVGVFLNSYADRLALQHEGSLAQVGVYGIAYRLALIAGLALVGFQGAVMPLVLSRHDDPATRVDLAHLFRIFCALALGVVLLLSVLAAPAVRLLAAPAYSGAAAITPYVVVATLLGGMYMFAPGLIIAKRTGVLALIAVSSGVLNAALAFAAVPLLGIQGAAIATLVSSIWYFGIMLPLSQRLYHVPYDWPRIATAATVIAALVIVSQTAISTGHDAAFSTSALMVRAGLLTVGVVGLVWLLIAPDERATIQSCLRHRLVHMGRFSRSRS